MAENAMEEAAGAPLLPADIEPQALQAGGE